MFTENTRCLSSTAAGRQARCAAIRGRLSAALALTALALFVTAQALAAPAIQTWTTANGARVLFVPAPEIPMLDVRVVFDAGSARDGDKPGLMKLVNSLLSEGAGEWDADRIAERLDGVGAQLGTGSLRDMAWVSVTNPDAGGGQGDRPGDHDTDTGRADLRARGVGAAAGIHAGEPASKRAIPRQRGQEGLLPLRLR